MGVEAGEIRLDHLLGDGRGIGRLHAAGLKSLLRERKHRRDGVARGFGHLR